ncbi:MAG: GNAT family N-acetyltransferase [Planctomycetes bacterium]|nr:GNAT family N-acetyltransferase [Planctomycetota bacterium]
MRDETAVCRAGTPEDSAAILDVMSKAFRFDESHAKWPTCRQMAYEEPHTFRVVESSGRVVSVARIHREELRVGRCAVVKGDVGHVSTHPDFQGRGFGSRLMRDSVRWMRENGYDISRLGGLVKFYSRFGWSPFPRRYVEFLITDVKAGASTLSPTEALRPLKDFRGVVRPFDAASDQTYELRYRFNENRTGAYFLKPPAPFSRRSAPRIPSGSDPLRLVCERDDKLLGYVFGHEYPHEVSPFEAKITIGDAAFDLDEPQAVEALLKRILLTAYERGVQRVTARLPFDPTLCAIMTRSGIGFTLQELHSAVASNMIQTINLHSLFSRMAGELEARLTACGVARWTDGLVVAANEQTVLLDWQDGRLAVRNATEARDAVALDQAVLLSLVFGIRSFEEVAPLLRHPLPPARRMALSVMFPRQPTASGPWG